MATTRLLSAMVATWNNVATTFTGLKLNVTDTASAVGSLLMDLQVGGVSQLNIAKSGVTTGIGSFITTNGNFRAANNSSVFSLGASNDVILARDAANILALRNGTAAQTSRVYNTYTDASNYEFGEMGWTQSGGNFWVGTSRAGTGSARRMKFVTAGTARWIVQTDGNFLAETDNTYDIGASGANRPRNIYAGGFIAIGGNAQVGAASGYGWAGTRGQISQATDGAYTFANSAATNSFTITAGASGLTTFTGTIASANSVWVGINSGVFVQGRSGFSSGADGTFRIQNNAGTITTDITISGASGSGASTATFGGSVAVASGGYIGWTGGKSYLMSGASGDMTLYNASGALSTTFTVGASNLLTLNGGLQTTGATFALQTATTLTDNAAAQVATMTNGPTAGNPTKWIAINDNGVTRYIPAW